MNNLQSTITAISTPPGTGGIAVIRISGPEAFNITQRIWKGKDILKMPHSSCAYGNITNGNSIIDEVIITKFCAPHSFTAEDTIEIACHGSTFIQSEILSLLCKNGATPAAPGEFTQRAFTNGRIDLAQAEGIADLIAAQSEAAHRLAISQTRGQYSKALDELRTQMINLGALLELELDFSEEDVEFADRTHLAELTQNLLNVTKSLADSYRTGNAIKNGIPVAIVGRPNAGKSTLLNALTGDDRAIVSDIPGTTRDTIEDTLTINGHVFRLIDTAGIRHTADSIEELGIRRSQQAIQKADIILWLTDPSQPLSPQLDQLNKITDNLLPHQTLIHILTKADKTVGTPTIPPHDLNINSHSPADILHIKQLLAEIAAKANGTENQLIITNTRHQQALLRAHSALERLDAGLHTGLSADFLAQDLREAATHLGAITGAITTPAILQTIFSAFCIGK